MKEVATDTLLVLFALSLFIIEFFASAPMIKGYLRIRSLFKIPFAYSFLIAHFFRKTRVTTNVEVP